MPTTSSTTMWKPSNPENTQWFKFREYVENKKNLKFLTDEDFQHWSCKQFPLFWQYIAEFFKLPLRNQPSQIFKKTGPELWQNQWFTNAKLNVTDMFLNHPEEDQALICINEAGKRTTYNYGALAHSVKCCAQALADSGIGAGDRVVGILPNNAMAIIAMLASAYLGAIWSSCSPEFGHSVLLDRLQQLEPSALFTIDEYHYQGKSYSMTEKIYTLHEQLPSLQRIIVSQENNRKSEFANKNNINKFISWDDFLNTTKPRTIPAASLDFSHPWVILFSSGTTGKPKCIIHGAGNTLIQHIKELGLHCNLNRTDKLFFYTTCGWMMWNWMASGLALGLCLILYDGSPMFPDTSRLWYIVANENVTTLGISPKYLSSLQQVNYAPKEHHDLSKLKLILSTGSPLLPNQYDFVYQKINSNVHLSSISGGTDIISCFILSHPLKPVIRGFLQTKGLGMNVQVLNTNGEPCIEDKGELVCSNPFPSMPLGFWQDLNNERLHNTYFTKFPNYWTHGDYAEETSGHYFIIYGRSDTTLNRGGIRIGSAEIYRVIENIPGIQEALVIGQDIGQDSRVILFVKLDNKHHPLSNEMKNLLKHKLREEASPRHVPDLIVEVPDIPKTINGKIVEQAVKQIVEGLPVTNLSAIVNPACLEFFAKSIQYA